MSTHRRDAGRRVLPATQVQRTVDVIITSVMAGNETSGRNHAFTVTWSRGRLVAAPANCYPYAVSLLGLWGVMQRHPSLKGFTLRIVFALPDPALFRKSFSSPDQVFAWEKTAEGLQVIHDRFMGWWIEALPPA